MKVDDNDDDNKENDTEQTIDVGVHILVKHVMRPNDVDDATINNITNNNNITNINNNSTVNKINHKKKKGNRRTTQAHDRRRRLLGRKKRLRHENNVAVDAVVTTISTVFDTDTYFDVVVPFSGIGYGDGGDGDSDGDGDGDRTRYRRLVELVPAMEWSRFTVLKTIHDIEDNFIYDVIEVYVSFLILKSSELRSTKKSKSKSIIVTTAQSLLDERIQSGSFLDMVRRLDDQIMNVSELYEPMNRFTQKVVAGESFAMTTTPHSLNTMKQHDSMFPDASPSSQSQSLQQQQQQQYEYQVVSPVHSLRVGGLILFLFTVTISLCLYGSGRRRHHHQQKQRRRAWILTSDEAALDAVLDRKRLGLKKRVFVTLMNEYRSRDVNVDDSSNSDDEQETDLEHTIPSDKRRRRRPSSLSLSSVAAVVVPVFIHNPKKIIDNFASNGENLVSYLVKVVVWRCAADIRRCGGRVKIPIMSSNRPMIGPLWHG